VTQNPDVSKNFTLSPFFKTSIDHQSTNIFAETMYFMTTLAFNHSVIKLSNPFIQSDLFTASDYLRPQIADADAGFVQLSSQQPLAIGVIIGVVLAALALALLLIVKKKRKEKLIENSENLVYETESRQIDLTESDDSEIDTDGWDDDALDQAIESAFHDDQCPTFNQDGSTIMFPSEPDELF
jgi:hypothetical protein